MLKRHLLLAALLGTLFSTSARAVYFPNGIDWTNTSAQQFVFSMYLNVLGRAPESSELRSTTQRLARKDNSEIRLELFKQFLASTEYQRLFTDRDERWQVYRAPDLNYNRGNGNWRYQASEQRPAGFQTWELSGSSTQAVAQAMASFYDAYCYGGIPCVLAPEAASRRADPVIANQASAPAHACADESAQIAQFHWISFNGTTYPRGTDANTLCMGNHYYQAAGTLLQHYSCDNGYLNCRRDRSRDLRGTRTGRDDNGLPALFFKDGSRLVLASLDNNAPLQNTPAQPAPPVTASNRHECADATKATRFYQWRGANGSNESVGVGSNIVCMDNYYYVIEGMTLKHYSCDQGFSNCRANPQQDVTAQRRTRVDGRSALQFRNGTTLSLLDKVPATAPTNDLSSSSQPARPVQQPQRLAGQHECGVATQRLSQFRWTKNDGSSTWPDGVDGRVVCMDNAYYVIDDFVLRHHQCTGNFQNCRPSRGKDLIALRDSVDHNGLRTLSFANGDQLALISR